MKFSSLTQALAYRTTCLDCQRPVKFATYLIGVSPTEMHINNTSLVVSLALNCWQMSNKSVTYPFNISIDLITNIFSIDFDNYTNEIPIFIIYNYISKFLLRSLIIVSIDCCSGHKFSANINYRTNRIEDIQLISEYRNINKNIEIRIDHTQASASIDIDYEETFTIPNFTYSITDPDLLDIIKTSMILG